MRMRTPDVQGLEKTASELLSRDRDRDGAPGVRGPASRLGARRRCAFLQLPVELQLEVLDCIDDLATADDTAGDLLLNLRL